MLTSLEGTEVQATDREQWLAERRSLLGASDVAAIVGVSPYKTALQLYLEKTGAVADSVTSEAAEIGLLLEPVLASLYARRTGREIVRQQLFLRCPVYNFLSATLDGVTRDGRVVEFKTIGARMAHTLGEPGTDELPDHWLVQVQMQMNCSGADEVEVAVLVGGQEFLLYRVPRSDALIDEFRRRASEFWDRVLRREPPDHREADDARWLAYLHPEAEGAIDLDGDTALAGEAYLSLGAEIKGLEARREAARGAVLAAMEGHALATLPGGRRLARRVVTTVDRVQAMKGSTYAILTEKKGKS